MESAGGGGYGDPLTREPERVRQDVLAGYVSTARARLGYGVVLAPDGEVDDRATLAERARLAAARRRFPVVHDERDPYEGRRGKHRVLRLAPRLAHALRLETGDLVEMLGRHAAPLRAWVRRGRGSGVTHDARKNQRRPQPVCATSACVRRRLVEADGSLGDLPRA